VFKIIKELVTQQVGFEPTRYVLATFVEQLQTVTTTLFRYVNPPVRRKVAQLPPDEFLWNFVFKIL